MTTKQKWILRISVTVNLIFGITFYLTNTAYTYKLGILKRDVKVGVFSTGGKTQAFFKLPKGLTVRDVSEQGISSIDQFENHRFSIVITSDRDDLVDYNANKNKMEEFGNLYSADNH